MTKQQIAYLLLLPCSVVFYIFYQEWFSAVLLSIAVGLPFLSLVISLPQMLRAKITVDSPTSVPMHTQATAGLCCSVDLPYRGRIRLRRSVTGERWRGKQQTVLPTDHCGALEITSRVAFVYDRLGLIPIPVRVKGDRRTLVRPEPVEMVLPADVQKAVASTLAPKPGGGYSEYHELREYHPGDSLNHMHWKMTAKLGKPILREPMQPSVRWLLTLDIGGTAEQMDRKLGELLYIAAYFAEHNLPLDVAALTAAGVAEYPLNTEGDLLYAVDRLLAASPADSGTIQDKDFAALYRLHLGGEPQ